MRRVSLGEEWARVIAEREQCGDPGRLPWFGELRWHMDVITVALPWLREVVPCTPAGERRAAWHLPGDTRANAHDVLTVEVRGELVAVGESTRSNRGDVWTQLHLGVDGPSPALIKLDATETEMRWAVSRHGARVATTEVARDRLVVVVRDARGAEQRRFTVGDEDAVCCDALAIDDEGRCVLFATEGEVVIREDRRKRVWGVAGPLRSLHFATRYAALGMEDGKRGVGVVWMMHEKQTPSVIGAALPAAASPVTAIAIAPDERHVYWQAWRANGSPAVLRVSLDHGVTEIADRELATLGEEVPPGAWPTLALDPSCRRLAWFDGACLVIEPFEPTWTTL